MVLAQKVQWLGSAISQRNGIPKATAFHRLTNFSCQPASTGPWVGEKRKTTQVQYQPWPHLQGGLTLGSVWSDQQVNNPEAHMSDRGASFARGITPRKSNG